jgi:hypothetical protein
MEAINVIVTIATPISTFPTKVYLVRDEKGVINAHPGNKSFAFFSTIHITSFSLI